MARALMAAHATLPATLPLSLPPLTRALVGLAQIVLIWETRRTGRHALKALDAYLLRDIGLDIATAQAEAVKPFWQA